MITSQSARITLIRLTLSLITALLASGLSSPAAHAQDYNESLLYSFQGSNSSDGENPDTTLINVNGTLYGVTEFGGNNGRGTIYSFDPSTNTKTTLFSFSSYPNPNGGVFPQGGLVYDSATGKIFGMTQQGGTGAADGVNGIGTIFSFDPSTNTVSFLYSFKDHGDGSQPNTRMVDVNGTLYLTTQDGYGMNYGTIFSFNPSTNAFRTLHNFHSNAVDGFGPIGGLTYDSTSGLIYGTTSAGGSNNTGTIYSIKPDGTGYQVLYSFGSSASGDGNGPAGALTKINGIFYGTASGGGANNFGTVYAFDPTTNTETTLYSFQGIPNGATSGDGSLPIGDLAYDSATGQLVGTTERGGTPPATQFNHEPYSGTVFAIKPDGTGYHQVYVFQGAPNDASLPITGLLDVNGILYGTTVYGGVYDEGAIYSLTATTFTLPKANNDSGRTAFQTPVTITAPGILANDNLGGSNKVTTTLVTNVTHGTLVLNSNGSFVYTPANGFLGTDSFSYYDTNPAGKSNTATVTLNVTAIAPVAHTDAYSTNLNTALTVNAPGVLTNDNPGDTGTITTHLVSQPAHGTVSFHTDGSFIYTPTNGFQGTDTFTYNDTNAIGTSNTGTVSIKVLATPPVASNDTYSLTYNTTLTVAAPGVLANDTAGSGSSLTAVLVSNPGHGSLTLNANGSFVYTPTIGFIGTDVFSYKDTTTLGTSNTATVTLTVHAALPKAANDAYAPQYETAQFQTPYVVPAAKGVLANDNAGGSSTLTATLVSTVTHGSLSFQSDGSFSYTPADGFLGTDSFTYYDTNSFGTSNTATVTLNVHAVAPVAHTDTYNVSYNTTLTISAPGVLADDYPGAPGTLTAALVSGVSHGTLSLHADGSFSYTPTSGYVGSDSFTYNATNSVGTSNTGTVNLTVLPALPKATNDNYAPHYETALSVSAPGVLGNDDGGGNSTLSAALVSNPSHGTLNFHSDGSFVYTPANGFAGTDSFTYQAVNAAGSSNVATVTLTISAVAPIAVNNSNNVKKNTPFSVPAPGVLGNDDTGGSSPMTAVLVTSTSHGTLTLNSNGAFIYTPNTDFTGTDSFTYQAVNSVGTSNIATATLIVQ